MIEKESTVPASISDSVTTTPKVTPSKSRAQTEKIEKTPQSSVKKARMQIQSSPSNSKSTQNGKNATPKHDEGSSPHDNAKRMGNGLSDMVDTDTETDNFWEEDLSIEMVTDIGDGDVDEEVFPLSINLLLSDDVLFRYLLQLRHFSHCIIAKSGTISAYLNAHNPHRLPNSMPFKPSSGFCAKMEVRVVLTLPLMGFLLWFLRTGVFVYAVVRKRKDTGVVIETIVMKRKPSMGEI